MRSPGFYRGMGIVAVLVVIVAFVPGFVSPTRNGPVTPLAWLHGAVASAWLGLFLVQATLIARGRSDLHRRLGPIGAVLAVALVWLGYSTSLEMGKRGYDLSGDIGAAADPLYSLVFPLGDLLSFTVLVTAGLWWRRQPERHGRLMLLATTGSLMAAPLAHLIGRVPALQDKPPVILLPLAAFYLAGAVRDRLTLGRFHPVSLWGGVALLAWAQLRAVVIGPSEVWRGFAGWLVG